MTSVDVKNVRGEVVGSAADDAAEVVGRHDLRSAVVAPGEMRLARPRGSDEDQECGIGQVLHTQECVRADYEATPL